MNKQTLTRSHIHINTILHTQLCYGCFPGKLELPVAPLHSQPTVNLILSILMGQAKTFHIFIDTVTSGLIKIFIRAFHLSSSLDFHTTPLDPINTIYEQLECICQFPFRFWI